MGGKKAREQWKDGGRGGKKGGIQEEWAVSARVSGASVQRASKGRTRVDYAIEVSIRLFTLDHDTQHVTARGGHVRGYEDTVNVTLQQLATPQFDFSIARRYNRFATLHSQLVDENPGCPGMPSLPSRRGALLSSTPEPDFVALRMTKLDRYLWSVMAHPLLARSPALFDFLELNASLQLLAPGIFSAEAKRRVVMRPFGR